MVVKRVLLAEVDRREGVIVVVDPIVVVVLPMVVVVVLDCPPRYMLQMVKSAEPSHNPTKVMK